jgi:AmmeMemoRadiSam system protein B/AmmeMemoRadiSam system protein A
MFCCAGLLMAPSCQEENEPAAPEPEEKKVVAENKPAGPPFEAQVAGGFYPRDADELKGMIRGYLDAAKKADKKVEGDLLGIMVPHAGYPYSGPIAAHAFGLLEGRKYKRVVVLGPAHRHGHAVPALLDAGAYRTPLGDIPIDREGVKQLAASGAAQIDDSKFRGEHALEVELPFLQVVLSGFEIVPVMIGGSDPATMSKLAKAIKQAFPGPDTLVVASTDMSHDYPYDVAVAMDKNALRLIQAMDPEGLFKAYLAYRRAGAGIKVGKDGRPEPDCTQLCGMGPVLTLLYLAKEHGGGRAVVLDRRNSGDIVGNKKSRIVGYSAVAVALLKERTAAKEEDFLSHDEKQALLKIARETLVAYLEKKEKKDFEPASKKLKDPGAAFVTLKNHGRLRGCIGYMEPIEPLWEMIRNRAIDAATRDTRFRPVTKDELKDISIEISVLSPRMPVKDPLKEIKIGRDGVWLELGRNRGVFLPQVPVEQNWTTVEQYLDHLCQKAHVFQHGCWKSKEAKIMRFTALVFGEEE